MEIYRDLLQRSDEWYKIREMTMTGSNATAIGNCGAGLKTYINNLMCEVLVKQEEQYVSKDMERGIELESLARLEYELMTGLVSTEVGFIKLDDYVGVSPDGITFGKNGKIIGGQEIKAKNDLNHWNVLTTEKIDSGTMWQIQMCLRVTDAEWWDFISFNPNFKHSCKIIRVSPDLERFKKLDKGFEMGKKLINDLRFSNAFKFEYGKNKSAKIKEVV